MHTSIIAILLGFALIQQPKLAGGQKASPPASAQEDRWPTQARFWLEWELREFVPCSRYNESFENSPHNETRVVWATRPVAGLAQRGTLLIAAKWHHVLLPGGKSL